MLDPPFERTLRDRIGADSELVRSLAPLLARAARREGRHHRAGGAELVREIEMVDGSAAVVEQRPLYEALSQDLDEEVDVALRRDGAVGDMMQAGNMVRIPDARKSVG